MNEILQRCISILLDVINILKEKQIRHAGSMAIPGSHEYFS